MASSVSDVVRRVLLPVHPLEVFLEFLLRLGPSSTGSIYTSLVTLARRQQLPLPGLSGR